MTRILVVASSLFGANLSLAGILAPVLEGLGAQARVRRAEAQASGTQPDEVAQASADDLEWADGFVFSSPSHTGLLSASMKAFIDAHHEAAVGGRYLNKSFTAMATSGFAHAGQERVVDDLNAIAAAWGCIVVTPSTANADINRLDGNPYGLSFVLQHGRLADVDIIRRLMEVHFTRFVAVTNALAPLRSSSSDQTAAPSQAEPRRASRIADVL